MGQSFPAVSVNIRQQVGIIDVSGRSILLVGQKTSAGSATSGALVDNISTEKEFNDYFGAKSQVAKAGRALLKFLSQSVNIPKISAISLSDNASGVAASGSIAISGTSATASGKLTFYIDSKVDGKYEIDVAVGDTPSAVATKLGNAITANIYSPVSSSVSTGTVTLTAVNKGTCGNDISIVVDGTVAGLTTTITAMSSGATDPALTGLFDAIDGVRYSSIVYPQNYTLSVLTDLLDARINPDDDFLAGQGFITKSLEYADAVDDISQINKQVVCYLVNPKVNLVTGQTGAIIEDNLVISALVAGTRELRLTQNSNTANISVSSSTGGPKFAAVPYAGVAISRLPAIKINQQFTKSQVKAIENAGGCALVNNIVNSNIVLPNMVTTYLKNSAGVADTTFKYLNTIDCLTVAQEFFFVNLKKDCQEAVLTNGRLTNGVKQINGDSFVALLAGYYAILANINGVNYGVFENSQTALASFKQSAEDALVITLSTGTITTKTINQMVSQVRNVVVDLIPKFD